ncbi:MAG: crotonase/enoyl-CoA hydratase family protein [Alphaproteobacteria bacterium]|nr:crotonase/enoyl-CoA hydratase family protein [Alphaproteobacteria bacterium]
MSRSFEHIIYTVEAGVAQITLNRPDRLNAFTQTMQDELIEAFDRIDADDEVRCVIVTGAGRGFCAGADLSGGAETFNFSKSATGEQTGSQPDGSDPRIRDGGGKVSLRIFECLKPVIAAVNGPAVGVGATMQLPMDIRIASDAARFGFVFTRRGVVPEACSSWFLPRIVGISTAAEWCFTGRVFDAAEALSRGLVSRVVSPDELLPTARALAREIADNTAPVSVALSRQMLWRMLGADHPMEAHKIDSRGIFARGQQADAREGVTSFLEKRRPSYPDKVSSDMPAFFPWWPERPYS